MSHEIFRAKRSTKYCVPANIHRTTSVLQHPNQPDVIIAFGFVVT